MVGAAVLTGALLVGDSLRGSLRPGRTDSSTASNRLGSARASSGPKSRKTYPIRPRPSCSRARSNATAGGRRKSPSSACRTSGRCSRVSRSRTPASASRTASPTTSGRRPGRRSASTSRSPQPCREARCSASGTPMTPRCHSDCPSRPCCPSKTPPTISPSHPPGPADGRVRAARRVAAAFGQGGADQRLAFDGRISGPLRGLVPKNPHPRRLGRDPADGTGPTRGPEGEGAGVALRLRRIGPGSCSMSRRPKPSGRRRQALASRMKRRPRTSPTPFSRTERNSLLDRFVTEFTFGRSAGPFLSMGRTEPSDDEIVLVDWPESPIKGLKPGDPVTLKFFEPETEGGAKEASVTLKFAGTIPLAGPAADPSLTPPFPASRTSSASATGSRRSRTTRRRLSQTTLTNSIGRITGRRRRPTCPPGSGCGIREPLRSIYVNSGDPETRADRRANGRVTS